MYIRLFIIQGKLFKGENLCCKAYQKSVLHFSFLENSYVTKTERRNLEKNAEIVEKNYIWLKNIN